MKNILDTIGAYGVSLLAFGTSTLEFAADLNWMAVGAGALLVARLIQDIPPAYIKIKDFIKGNKDDKS